ncbi:MAG TPA: Holliday junction branch migration protein RuvA [Rhizomicrobium sp.]|nr:Holliday junction branch migration protein RuvA [Rhizomicrobium sp.]
MIGKLTGIVDSLGEDHAILDVNGVGYLVNCPSSTLSKLAAGNTASLMIETRVTDETIKLYGFSSNEEREWFRLLQTVQNVGARVALNVLSALSPRDLERALALGDKAAIGRAQGVGPKLALRIVTELKDKAPAMMLRGHGDETVAHAAPRGPEADAVAALIGLGYSPSQASETVARVAHESGALPVEALIRESLRRMGARG